MAYFVDSTAVARPVGTRSQPESLLLFFNSCHKSILQDKWLFCKSKIALFL